MTAHGDAAALSPVQVKDLLAKVGCSARCRRQREEMHAALEQPTGTCAPGVRPLVPPSRGVGLRLTASVRAVVEGRPIPERQPCQGGQDAWAQCSPKVRAARLVASFMVTSPTRYEVPRAMWARSWAFRVDSSSGIPIW